MPVAQMPKRDADDSATSAPKQRKKQTAPLVTQTAPEQVAARAAKPAQTQAEFDSKTDDSPAGQGGEGKALTVQDRLDIQDLIHLNMQYLDRKMPKEWASLFLDTGAVEVVVQKKTHQGTAALHALCCKLNELFAQHTHWEANVVVSGTRTKAVNYSYWKAILHNNITASGQHEDTFMRDGDGKWKFSHRRITHNIVPK